MKGFEKNVSVVTFVLSIVFFVLLLTLNYKYDFYLTFSVSLVVVLLCIFNWKKCFGKKSQFDRGLLIAGFVIFAFIVFITLIKMVFVNSTVDLITYTYDDDELREVRLEYYGNYLERTMFSGARGGCHNSLFLLSRSDRVVSSECTYIDSSGNESDDVNNRNLRCVIDGKEKEFYVSVFSHSDRNLLSDSKISCKLDSDFMQTGPKVVYFS